MTKRQATSDKRHVCEGQAIIEYLLLGAAVAIAIALVVGPARAKARQVVGRALNQTDAIPGN